MENEIDETEEKKLNTADEFVTINYDDGEDTDEIEVLEPYLVEALIDARLNKAISKFVEHINKDGDTRTEEQKKEDIIPEEKLYNKPIKEVNEKTSKG